MQWLRNLAKNEYAVAVASLFSVATLFTSADVIGREMRTKDAYLVQHKGADFVVTNGNDGSVSVQTYPFEILPRKQIIDKNGDGNADVEFNETYASSGARVFPFSYELPVKPGDASLFREVLGESNHISLDFLGRLCPAYRK